MYVDTTRTQAIRAFAGWLLAVGVALFFLTGGQLFVGEDKDWPLVAVGIVLAGFGILWWGKRRLRALDRVNRPFLFGEGGASIMRRRGATEARILVASRWLLASFLVSGVAFFFLLSGASCGDRIDGYCGSVGTPSDAVINAAQLISISLGAAWVAAVALRRTHEKESERIDVVVAEGQRSRRRDHPLSGMDRMGWE